MDSEEISKENLQKNELNIEKDNKKEKDNNYYENSNNIEMQKKDDLINKYDNDNDNDNINPNNLIMNKQLNNENFLLNKKTKPDNEIIVNECKDNEIKKEENIKNKEEYEYGYSIVLLKDKEEGLMEDFLKEMPIESDISDFYNYHLDEEKWQKILHHSILVHYERHLKEEMEKRKKMQNMFMFNMNINMNMNNNNIMPTNIMPQMNSLMMNNMGSMGNIGNMANMTNLNNNTNGFNYQIQMPTTQSSNKNKNIQNSNNK